MEVKIKQGKEMIDATIDMVDGVMVVSPKEVKIDVTQFNDGDVITCGWDESNLDYSWTSILQGDIEYISDNMFIGDYCSIDIRGEFLDHNSNSDSATWVRHATEEEKQKLFDKLSEKGLAWDAERKELVKIKWKPKVGDTYFRPDFNKCRFLSYTGVVRYNTMMYIKAHIDKGWCFKTEQECQEFCNRLNDAINQVKP